MSHWTSGSEFSPFYHFIAWWGSSPWYSCPIQYHSVCLIPLNKLIFLHLILNLRMQIKRSQIIGGLWTKIEVGIEIRKRKRKMVPHIRTRTSKQKWKEYIPNSITIHFMYSVPIILILFLKGVWRNPIWAERTEHALMKIFIINLFHRKLTEITRKVLSRGLSFIPTTGFKTFTWGKDLNLFVRKCKWHKFYRMRNVAEAETLGLTREDLPGVKTVVDLLEESEGINKTGYNNPKLTCSELEEIGRKHRRVESNFSRNEIEALLSLEKDESIIIKKTRIRVAI